MALQPDGERLAMVGASGCSVESWVDFDARITTTLA
jgi:hypothetical protein